MHNFVGKLRKLKRNMQKSDVHLNIFFSKYSLYLIFDAWIVRKKIDFLLFTSDPISTFETYHSTHLNSFVIFVVNPFVTIFFTKYFRLVVPLLRFKILNEWRKEHKIIYMTVPGVICKARQKYLYVLWLTTKRYISLLRFYRRHKKTNKKK